LIGGALITAEIANNYNREVFCIPGNVGEKCFSRMQLFYSDEQGNARGKC